MNRLCVILLAPLLIGCTDRQHPVRARIDHIIVGVSDLQQGMVEIERLTGVRPALGGAHPGAGTRNALLSLGKGSYLEIYAPNPAEPVATAEVARLRTLNGPTPLGWAVSTDNDEALRSMMMSRGFSLSPSEPGSRRKPDGTLLNWTTWGFANFDHPLAPFFIQWGNPALHPSHTSPSDCLLQSISIQDPAPEQLRRAIDPLRLQVVIAKMGSPGMTVTLICPRGTITLG